MPMLQARSLHVMGLGIYSEQVPTPVQADYKLKMYIPVYTCNCLVLSLPASILHGPSYAYAHLCFQGTV